jgi:hypothetical protein
MASWLFKVLHADSPSSAALILTKWTAWRLAVGEAEPQNPRAESQTVILIYWGSVDVLQIDAF